MHAAPGDLVHVDIKKLGRIPERRRLAGPWPGSAQDRRVHVARTTQPAPAHRLRGYAYLHHAVDDHSRLAYSEIHADERKETAVGVLATSPRLVRPPRHHRASRADRQRLLLPLQALGQDPGRAARIKHRRTRPYRPQTNGKVERFNRTLLEEWAYAHEYRSEAERLAAYPAWLHFYNHHRGHTALKGKSPIDLVPNVPGREH